MSYYGTATPLERQLVEKSNRNELGRVRVITEPILSVSSNHVNNDQALICFVTELLPLPDDSFLGASHASVIKRWRWSSDGLQCIQEFRAHSETVVCLASVSGDEGRRFVSGSNDGTANLWCLQTSACLCTFEGHNFGVASLLVVRMDTTMGRQQKERILISGSHDKTIKLWQLDPEPRSECFDTLLGHTSRVCSLHELSCGVDGRRLFVSADPKNVLIWDLISRQRLHTLSGFSAPLNSMIVLKRTHATNNKATNDRDDVIVTAEKDILKMWRVIRQDHFFNVNENSLCDSDCQESEIVDSVRTEYIRTVAELHSGRIQCLINLRDGGFATCGMDHSIRGWTSEGICLFRCNLSQHDAQLHWLPIVIVELRDGIIASGDFEGTIMLWKVKDDNRLTTLCAKTLLKLTPIDVLQRLSIPTELHELCEMLTNQRYEDEFSDYLFARARVRAL